MSDQETTARMSAADYLRSRGHVVEATDIPGLYRVNGGPEITTGQLWAIAHEEMKRG